MTRLILTKRLVLRPFTPKDGPRVVALLNDFEVSKWLAVVPHPFTADDLRLMNDDGSERWPDLAAITLGGEVVGGISTGCHLGYWIGRPYWGQGIATEAAVGMLSHVFAEQGRDQIASGYFTGNVASGRILHRLGFRETARNMKANRARGVEVSNVDMTLTRTDWERA